MKKSGDFPAFPTMTYRQWLIGQALTGLIMYRQIHRDGHNELGISNPSPELVAIWACQYADFTIKEMKEKK